MRMKPKRYMNSGKRTYGPGSHGVEPNKLVPNDLIKSVQQEILPASFKENLTVTWCYAKILV